MMSINRRKLFLALSFLFIGFLLLKLNYAADFQQNFPPYKAGRLLIPTINIFREIKSVPFFYFLIFISSVFAFFANTIPEIREIFRHVFLRNKRAVTGLVLLILTLIPDSSRCYSIVGFMLTSLGLFFIVLYFLRPIISASASFMLRVKKYILSVATRYLVAGVFLAVFFATNMISYKVFNHYPHIFDSTAQVFQAKIFQRGQLTAEAPGPRKFFLYNNVIIDIDGRGRWYSQYPPGHSFLLLLGLLISSPWIINPLFGSLSVVMLYFLGRELYGEATARLSLILGAFSPFILFMSSEYMNHTTAAFFLILGFYGGFRAEKAICRQSADDDRQSHEIKAQTILCGAALGMAHLIRPFSAFVISFPLLTYLVIRWARRGKLREIGFLLLPLVFFAGIFLAYNTLTNGHPFLSGYKVLYKSQLGIGFGYSIRGFPPHTPRLGLRNMLNNINELNLYLFQWPIPSLAFVAVLLASGRLRKEDKLLFICFAALWGAFFFYWAQQLLFGPRYMYEGSFILILLTARGILFVKDILGRKVEGRFWGVLTLCMLVGLFHTRSLALFYANDYCHFNPTLLENIKKEGLKNALVFSPFHHLVFAETEPDPNAGIIFARDLGEEENKELIRQYPGRKLYRTSVFNLYPYYPYQRIDHDTYHKPSTASRK